MCSFVGNKKNKYWIWPGIDVKTKEINGIHIGRRSRKDARKFRKSFPPSYRQKTKNDHFADMLADASAKGLEPSCVLFDSWYSGLNNLKAVRKAASVSESGTVVHLKHQGIQNYWHRRQY